MTTFQTITPELYVSANAECIAENCIKFLLWEDRSVEKTIEESVEHATEIIPGIAGKLSSDVWNVLVKATESTEAFNRFVNSRRKVLVRPLRKSANEYIRMELETALSVQEIITIVKTDMGV